jgi:uncharacterized membrane protein
MATRTTRAPMGAIRKGPAGPPTSAIHPSPGGIGRGTSEAAEVVSDALRRGAGPFLDQRRRTAAFTLGSMAALGAVAAYQLGLVRHLPEPPLPMLDADRVDASGEAYQQLKTPDAALGLASAAVTLVLTGMGGPDRHRTRRWIPVVLAVKAAGDALGGAFLTVEQATTHRRFCGYCLVSALANVGAALHTIPEAMAAVRAQPSVRAT